MLTTDKAVKRFRINVTHLLERNKGLYKINPQWIAIKQVKGKNKHLEIYFNEDCPTPVGSNYSADTFLDELIFQNGLKQTSSIKTPRNASKYLIYFLIFGFIALIGAFLWFNPQILEGVF